MRISTAFVAAIATSSLTSIALAGQLPAGFNITCQVGAGPLWQAINNPGDFNTTQTPNGAIITGDSIHAGGLWTATWEVEYTVNPSITTAWSFTNTSGQDSFFTVIFISPIDPIFGPTTMHGSITGGLTDNSGNGATLSAPQDGSVYTAMVDGNFVSPTLFNDPFSVSTTPPDLTAPLGFETFQNAPGPIDALVDIGIRHTFWLSAGDSVTFNSAFTIIPAPAGLAAFAVFGIFGGRRRR